MAWFPKLESDGRDLYPLLKKNFEKPGYYVNEKVRGETMRHFGYFMTESSGHLPQFAGRKFRTVPAIRVPIRQTGEGVKAGH